MYESPITIYQQPEYRRMSESVDALVIEECRRVGVAVNKDELIKALQYDRGQYEKGYEDGKMEGNRLVYCNECVYYKGVRGVPGHAPCAYWGSCGVMYNGFCSNGRRKVGDEDECD